MEQVVADTLLENRLLKKAARQTLRDMQLPRATFYGWYRRYRAGGLDDLQARPRRRAPLESRPGRLSVNGS